MIHESYTWKQDLIKQRDRIAINVNKKRDEETLASIEKGVFFSAFIIRKLMDCPGKVSDEVDMYRINTIAFSPLKKIDFYNRWIDSESHDWENGKRKSIEGRRICNMLIHSLVFSFEYSGNNGDDPDYITGFLVSSDYSEDLYCVSISDWLEFVEFVATDDVVYSQIKYDVVSDKHYYVLKKRLSDGRLNRVGDSL